MKRVQVYKQHQVLSKYEEIEKKKLLFFLLANNNDSIRLSNMSGTLRSIVQEHLNFLCI